MYYFTKNEFTMYGDHDTDNAVNGQLSLFVNKTIAKKSLASRDVILEQELSNPLKKYWCFRM